MVIIFSDYYYLFDSVFYIKWVYRILYGVFVIYFKMFIILNVFDYKDSWEFIVVYIGFGVCIFYGFFSFNKLKSKEFIFFIVVLKFGVCWVRVMYLNNFKIVFWIVEK